MTPKIANYWVLDNFGAYLSMVIIPEDAYPFDPNYDVNDCRIYKEAFRAYGIAYFNSLRADSKFALKENLKYFLTTRHAPFGTMMDDWQDTNLPCPDDPVIFFQWLWEVLFPDEDFRMETLEGWIEKPDRDAACALYAVAPPNAD